MKGGGRLYLAYATALVVCLMAALISGAYWVAGIPPLLAVGLLTVMDVRPLFWLLLVMIPLGTEITLPGGVGTDLPTEPIAVGLAGFFILHAGRHWARYRSDTFLHPIALFLYAHLAWIVVAAVGSEIFLVSLKFTLAKSWYVAAFFLLPLLLLDTPRRVTVFAHCIFWPLLFVALQSLVRHAGYGFSFADQFRTLHPFMRNHVAYAGCLAAFAPWVGYLLWRRKRAGGAWVLWLVCIGSVWLAAIYFSFTRAAYVSLLLAGAGYFAVRWRLLRYLVPLALVAGLVAAGYLVRNDNYLDYAPDYDNTISHRQFDELISATYKLEDISTMERFYRWVAGGNMVPYRPVAGYGPGNFVELYQGYTNNNFRTYVSDNPERSGIHNYYLMTLVEQGYVGLFLLLALLTAILLYGEGLYHAQRDPAARAAIMAALLSVVVIDAFGIINDVLETDKVGSLFFLAAAIIVTMGQYRSGQLGAQQQQGDRYGAHADE